MFPQGLIDAQKRASEKKLELGDEEKSLTVLANEGEMQKKEWAVQTLTCCKDLNNTRGL